MMGGLDYTLKTAATLPLIENEASTLELVKAFAKSPLSFEPGTNYQYSLCHDVLAAVVEVASGMKFSEFLRLHFFEPLGIKDMGFLPGEEQKKRFVAMYRHHAGTATAEEIPCYNEMACSRNFESGGGGLFSTVDDYMKIITATACGEILSQNALKMMGENRLPPHVLDALCNKRKRLYGYGWGLCGRTHMNSAMSLSLSPVGEFGWDGAANAFVIIDPINQVAAYFGTQIKGAHYGYNILHPVLRNLIYEGLAE